MSDTALRIRETFDRVGFTEAGIRERLQIGGIPPFRQRAETLPLWLWRTRAGTPLDVFVRLFLLRQAVALDAVERALEPMSVDDWAHAGLLRGQGSEVSATLEICLQQGLLATADWAGCNREIAQPVMPVAGTSRDLAAVTVRRQSSRTLDLGTGCGILAFLAAPHSTQVVGVDRNPRAVELARFNAELNRIRNTQWLVGDLFEPVRDQSFDLIFCNPPFIIAPGTGSLHSYGGRPADQLCESVVRTAPQLLREGGFCQVLCNWAVITGESWQSRLAGWVQGSGCDAWILYSEIQDVASYASQRIEERADPEEQADRVFVEWMAYYQAHRIEAVGFGLVTLRRATKPANWFRCERLPELKGACGDAIERGFASRDFLESSRDEAAFLRARLQPAAGLRWEQIHEVTSRGLSPVSSRLRLAAGLAYVGDANPDVVTWISRSTGNQSLGEQLAELAAATGQEIQNLAPPFLKVVRRLLELGLLVTA